MDEPQNPASKDAIHGPLSAPTACFQDSALSSDSSSQHVQDQSASAAADLAVPGNAAIASPVLSAAGLSLAHQHHHHASKAGGPRGRPGSAADPMSAAKTERAERPPTLPFIPADSSAAHQQAGSKAPPIQLPSGTLGMEEDASQKPPETGLTASIMTYGLSAAPLAKKTGPDIPLDGPAASQHGPPAPPDNFDPPPAVPSLQPPRQGSSTDGPVTAVLLPGAVNHLRLLLREQHAPAALPPEQQLTPAAPYPPDHTAPTAIPPSSSSEVPFAQLADQDALLTNRTASPAMRTQPSMNLSTDLRPTSSTLKELQTAYINAKNGTTDPDLQAALEELAAQLAKSELSGSPVEPSSSADSPAAETIPSPAMVPGTRHAMQCPAEHQASAAASGCIPSVN